MSRTVRCHWNRSTTNCLVIFIIAATKHLQVATLANRNKHIRLEIRKQIISIRLRGERKTIQKTTSYLARGFQTTRIVAQGCELSHHIYTISCASRQDFGGQLSSFIMIEIILGVFAIILATLALYVAYQQLKQMGWAWRKKQRTYSWATTKSESW